ncbi:DNA-formamidopyrimidine glycosylase [Mycoplasma phocoeninasale]|uniref:DNA-formamidopyrimidine glycosylase n=1 Tax=Mycoplasma phocoeninasale TaxID=2726117 RepID=UPI001966D922|nr:DNA-formamidopyrimidine glycosylase [Mycoplasma phocoeninasale]MBN0970985.1 DNA-formamidopyrimidine glycosylase [Mycoplasma phocoeninasale]
MPELPEVKVVCKALKANILNKKISEILIFKPKLFKEKSPSTFIESLKNKIVLDINNIGKHIIIKLSDNLILLSHLRMEGKYRFYQKNQEINDPNLVMKIYFDSGESLHYVDSRMFGTFHLRNYENYDKILPISKVAPEPSVNIAEDVFGKIHRSSTPIKTKLLDQSIVAGIGNIYIDEALFAAKIHPTTPSSHLSLSQITEILKNAKSIMDKSFEKGGTTLISYESLNKQIGEYQNFLKIHSDKIKNCLDCGKATEKIKVNQRGTYTCPNCQKVY